MKTFHEWLVENHHSELDEGILDYLGKSKTIRNTVAGLGVAAAGTGIGQMLLGRGNSGAKLQTGQAAQTAQGQLPAMPSPVKSHNSTADQFYVNNAKKMFTQSDVFNKWYKAYTQKRDEIINQGNDAGLARQVADQSAKEDMFSQYKYALKLQQQGKQWGDTVHW